MRSKTSLGKCLGNGLGRGLGKGLGIRSFLIHARARACGRAQQASEKSNRKNKSAFFSKNACSKFRGITGRRAFKTGRGVIGDGARRVGDRGVKCCTEEDLPQQVPFRLVRAPSVN